MWGTLWGWKNSTGEIHENRTRDIDESYFLFFVAFEQQEVAFLKLPILTDCDESGGKSFYEFILINAEMDGFGLLSSFKSLWIYGDMFESRFSTIYTKKPLVWNKQRHFYISRIFNLKTFGPMLYSLELIT